MTGHLPTGGFVGRERELDELRRGLEQAEAGRGRLFLLSGEPGIGKTRLAEEIAAEATLRKIRVVWGRCWEGRGAPAYWPWIQVIRGCLDNADAAQRSTIIGAEAAPRVAQNIAQLLPELRSAYVRPIGSPLSRPSDPEQARFELFDSVMAVLKGFARITPLLIVIDDLHDADHPSLIMQSFVANQVKDARIMIVSTYRDTAVRQSSELSRLMGDLNREAGSIPLAGLSPAEVGQLVRGNSEEETDDKLIAHLYEVTDGNPLFVDGIVRLLASEGKLGCRSLLDGEFTIPDGVHESIRRRLASLPEETRSLLSMASVIGNEFDVGILAEVSESPAGQVADRLEDAFPAGILVGRGAAKGIRYRFSHALIREAVYRDFSEDRRIEVHNRIGSAIEEVYKADLMPHLSALAYHHRAAGNIDKAVEYSTAAGEAAYAVLVYEDARSFWEEALALLKETSGNLPRRAHLLLRLANLSLVTGAEVAIRYGEEAIALFEKLGDEQSAAECHALLGTLLSTVSFPEADLLRATEHYRKAEAILSKSPDGEASARLYIGIAQAAYTRQRSVEGAAAASRAMAIAANRDEQTWAEAATQYGLHLRASGRLAEGSDLHEKAWQVANRLNAATAAFATAWTAGGCSSFLLNIPDAQRWYRRELESPRVARAPHHRRWLLSLLAEVVARAGDLATAQRLFTESGYWQSSTELLFFLGKWDEAAAEILRQIAKLRRTGDIASLGNRLSRLANIYLVSGALEKARATAEEYLLISTIEPRLTAEMLALPILAMICVQTGQLDQARRELIRCREIMSAGENWFGLTGTVFRAEAVVASAEHRFEDADAMFRNAVETFRRYQVPFEEAEAFYYWSRALSASGRKARSLEKLDAAIEIYRQAGAGPAWISRATAERDSPVADRQAIFRKDGDFWIIAYGQRTFRLGNLKGLGYIANLLAQPGTRIHACDLASMANGGNLPPASPSAVVHTKGLVVTQSLGDAGETLDHRAVADYRRRLVEVREELARGEADNDPGAIGRARHELELLGAQLAAGVSRGGRLRRSSSHVERARALVTKSIRSAIERIGRNDRKLGEHLAATIQTGTFCCYLPEPNHQPRWQT